MVKTLRQLPITCTGHTRPVVDLRFSDVTPYSYFLISACKDGKPMIREGDTGDWIGTLEGHKGAVWGATINSDATKAATAAADFTAKLWDAQTGAELHSFSHKHIVKSVDFAHDSTHLVTGGNDKCVRLYDLNNYTSDPLILTGHTGGIKKCIVLDNETIANNSGGGGCRRLASISDDKTMRIWDTVSGQEVRHMKFDSAPNSVELSRDSQWLILTTGCSVELYDAQSFEMIKKFAVPSRVSAASIHPDKSIFVCGCEDFTLYKYSIDTGAELESLKGHFGPIHCVQFSPDGEIYASGSEDGTLRLWQTTIGKTYGLWKLVDAPSSATQPNALTNSSGTETTTTDGSTTSQT